MTPDPVIRRVESLPPRGRRVAIHLDRGDPVEVSLEALERTRLCVGDPLPGNRRHHLLDVDADIGVRDAALHLISRRARTRAELERRMRRKGFASARIDPCLDRLEEKGLIDDVAVAAAFVRDRLRHRPRGRARLSAELRAKGLSGDVAQSAIAAVFDEEEMDDSKLALHVAHGWIGRQRSHVLAALASEEPSPEREKARRRVTGYLTRRGFRGDALRSAIDWIVSSTRRTDR